MKDNNTKIIIALDSFEAQLKPYLELEETKQYRSLLREFISVSQAINQKQLDFTQKEMNVSKIKIEKSKLEIDLLRIGNLLSATNNPSLLECVQFLGNFNRLLKRDIVNLLEMRRRALSYLTLESAQPTYRWGTVDELRSAEFELENLLLNSLNEKAGEEISENVEFIINRENYPQFFLKMELDGSASFTIPHDSASFNIGGTAFVTVDKVDIQFDKAAVAGKQYVIRMTHMGNPVRKNLRGKIFNFTHQERPTILGQRSTAEGWSPIFEVEGNLRGSDNRYLFLSPFATWVLRAEPPNCISFEKLTEMKLSFHARVIPNQNMGT
jgi:hypothetical protein